MLFAGGMGWLHVPYIPTIQHFLVALPAHCTLHYKYTLCTLLCTPLNVPALAAVDRLFSFAVAIVGGVSSGVAKARVPPQVPAAVPVGAAASVVGCNRQQPQEQHEEGAYSLQPDAEDVHVVVTAADRERQRCRWQRARWRLLERPGSVELDGKVDGLRRLARGGCQRRG